MTVTTERHGFTHTPACIAARQAAEAARNTWISINVTVESRRTVFWRCGYCYRRKADKPEKINHAADCRIPLIPVCGGECWENEAVTG